MLKLRTRIKINSRVEIKCEKHVRYNPEKDGRDGIKGACARCLFLYQIFNTWQQLRNAAADYEQLTQPYEKIKPRTRQKATELSPQLTKVLNTLLPEEYKHK